MKGLVACTHLRVVEPGHVRVSIDHLRADQDSDPLGPLLRRRHCEVNGGGVHIKRHRHLLAGQRGQAGWKANRSQRRQSMLYYSA